MDAALGTSPDKLIGTVAWLTADGINARRALGRTLAAHDEAPERVRLEARLADARLGYGSGDCAHGRRSLASALQLPEQQQLRGGPPGQAA